jgi:tetratricopeptide (TPR) repeat protein
LLGTVPTVEETDPEAYALFLQARQLGRQAQFTALERSNALYQQALAIEPDYAAAWAGLARNYSTQAIFVRRPIDEGFRPAREAANRPLAIYPEPAQAYATLSEIAGAHDNDLATAARHLERALELAPTDTDILGSAAGWAFDLGRLDEAIGLPPLTLHERHNDCRCVDQEAPGGLAKARMPAAARRALRFDSRLTLPR